MAGHSKWKQIKRKKAVTDARRASSWTKVIREITVAAKSGGGDPGGNPRLRTAIDAAKAVNMPKENIERAIKKGTGELEGSIYEELTYEGYGPGGAAIFIEVTTDNANRTVAEIRHAFSRNGGNLGASNSVAWMFDRKGQIYLDAARYDEDATLEAALDAGAEDFDAGGRSVHRHHRARHVPRGAGRAARRQDRDRFRRAGHGAQEHGQGRGRRRRADAQADGGARRAGRRVQGVLQLRHRRGAAGGGGGLSVHRLKVLGIDPGTAVLGYGVVETGPARQPRLVECGMLTTQARDSLPARLRVIHDGIAALIARHRPDAVAVESAFYGRNVRTTVVLSHARGVILLAAEEAAIPVAEYSPGAGEEDGGRDAVPR